MFEAECIVNCLAWNQEGKLPLITSLAFIKFWLTISVLHFDAFSVGLARLIEISVNRSIYNRKMIIDMKIQKLVTFNGCSIYLFN